VSTNQSLGVSTFGSASVSGQSYYGAFAMELTASNQFSTIAGSTISYVVTTDVPNGAVIVVAGEEDLADIIDSDSAMADARRYGTKPWRQVRKALGL
jgi:hypothetical protein